MEPIICTTFDDFKAVYVVSLKIKLVQSFSDNLWDRYLEN